MNQQDFDYSNLLKEAKMRWLKPAEILYILQNHENYPISQEAPQKPASGSLFLFNKRVLRHFRKDGHIWRKKKDGRNVAEAHERLKVGSVDALNCYYAHGEQNPYFQRRCYWILDPAYEHIVLVHYREVSEGRLLPSSVSNMSADSYFTFPYNTSITDANHLGRTPRTSEQYDPNVCPCSSLATVEEVSSQCSMGKPDGGLTEDGLRNFNLSPKPLVSLALRELEVQLSLDDDDDEKTLYFGEEFHAFNEYRKSQDVGLLIHEARESTHETHDDHFPGIKLWEHDQRECEKPQSLNVLGDKGKQGSLPQGSGYNVQTTRTSLNRKSDFRSRSAAFDAQGKTSDFFIPHSVLESSSYAYGRTSNLTAPVGILESSKSIVHDQALDFPFEKLDQFAYAQLGHNGNDLENRSCHFPESDVSLQPSATTEFLLGPENPIDFPTTIPQLSKVQLQNTYENSLCVTGSDMAELKNQNSADWMNATGFDAPKNTCSSELSTLCFDEGQFGNPLRGDSNLTAAEKRRFRIHEVSPEWAFSFESTKVIVIGDFLCSSSESPWAIMFGAIQVPAEIIHEGVLRCMSPQLSDGKVTFCVTCGDRESCSEIREFEFRAKPTTSSFIRIQPNADAMSSPEELLLLVRLVCMLLCGSDGLSTLNRGMGTESALKAEARWSHITEALLVGSEVPSYTIGWMMQELLKDKLQQWLSSKQGKDCLLSKQEQGIIHMVAGLGYGWALNPVLDSGVGVNFRDANGWTALHWAARFGREEMVAALLAAGASAGAVTDPTPLDPVGRTAGALASAIGHIGLAGYLSEAYLTSHLSSLTLGECEISEGPSELEAERAVESIAQRSVQMHTGGTEDELSLKDSLAAVRNATQAATRIQAAFRAYSFKKKLEYASAIQDEYGVTPDDMLGLSLKLQRAAHGPHDQKFYKAALSIQKNYRSWKGRKDFLTLRQSVIKIQAHVKGYQERKMYKVLVSTVSILEKLVLRWLRKGVGLRGYRSKLNEDEDEEIDDLVKAFRKLKVDAAIDQAVSRVLSMVESPTSRQQYRRMLERFRQAKAELSASDETTTRDDDFVAVAENNDFV